MMFPQVPNLHALGAMALTVLARWAFSRDRYPLEISSFDIDISPRVKVISVEESGTKDRAAKQVQSAEELFSELSQLGVL